MEHISEAITNLPLAVQEHIRNQGSTQASVDLPALRLEIVKTRRNELENCMGIPPRYRGKDLSTLNGFEREKIQALGAVSLDGSVFLSGSPGVGKTHFAVGLAWEWLKAKMWIDIRQDGYPVVYGFNYRTGDPECVPIFRSASDLYDELKSTFSGTTASTTNGVMGDYTKAVCLILDDVGAEQITDWKRSILYTLIDRRYRSMRQTIITSNLSLDEIAQKIDDRIASRLVEMGPVFSLTGEDYRITIARSA